MIKTIIIDDEKLAREGLKNLLKEFNEIEIIAEASNADEGLDLIDKLKPQLIFLDIQMPEKNGYDTSSEIRKNEKLKNLPIIALTAGIMVGEKEKCFDYGMNDYISKPFKTVELQTVINKYI
jgi:CheY-like chemotaxis protein